MSGFRFFDRDLSWLGFNERVLQEAAREATPLLEKIRFLSIYSSNLDEFYRVRIPVLMALQKINRKSVAAGTPAPTEVLPAKGQTAYDIAVEMINGHQKEYGRIIQDIIIPGLQQQGVRFIYNEPVPDAVIPQATEYFFTQVAGFIQPILLSNNVSFFPQNNQLYLAVVAELPGAGEQLYLVNIPSSVTGRFLRIDNEEGCYILFLEDIIRLHLGYLFRGAAVRGAWNIKITRDAELDLQDEYEEDLADKMEKQLTKRDFGFATRFLYEPGISLRHLQQIIQLFNLTRASVVEGGKHHHLRDLDALPVQDNRLSYPKWPAAPTPIGNYATLFARIASEDMMVHAPYQSYNTILRFFNEAVIDPSVTEIYTTLYRVASDSRIAQALISAARNGKKATVLVELKARFDEANNIRWAKKMKAAGVRIVYSINALKVHAKIALVKRNHEQQPFLGLLATGNLNETTARFYTDHILMTGHQPMLQEMHRLFAFLSKRKKPEVADQVSFNHLLVAQFNLQTKFLSLIDREIQHAAEGLPAAITLKMNNLEEQVLIEKLYEASNAGVRIQLIIRSICRLVPGVPGQSENISIIRIVDRYLEHGRVFIFHNNGNQEVFMGSSDWMNRNIYRRIEVCFPVYHEGIKKQVQELIQLQLNDNVQAVYIDSDMRNITVEKTAPSIRSQEAIYRLLSGRQDL